jgi:hypothetical protein
LYDRALLDQEYPFVELKRQSRINEIANRAPDEGFGEYVRRELPGYKYKTTDEHAGVEVPAS